MELSKTVKMMDSTDYKERFKAEYTFKQKSDMTNYTKC